MSYDDNLNLKQAIEEFDAQRAEYKRRIDATEDPNLKKQLLNELAQKEQYWSEELERMRNENEVKLKGKLR